MQEPTSAGGNGGWNPGGVRTKDGRFKASRLPADPFELSGRQTLVEPIMGSELADALRDLRDDGHGDAEQRGFIDSFLGVGGIDNVRLRLGGSKHVQRPSEENWVIYACLSVLEAAVRSVPLRLWDSDEPEADELPESHELYALFNRPHPTISGRDLLGRSLVDFKVDGEVFWFLADKEGGQLEPDGSGRIDVPGCMYPVRGNRISAKLDDLGFPTHWTYYNHKGASVTYPYASVFHMHGYDPWNPNRGLGDVMAALRYISLQFQAERYMDALLKNGGSPGGSVKVDRRLEPKQRREEQAKADEKFQTHNRNRWIVAGQGTEFVEFKNAPKDLEFRNLLVWVRDLIMAVMGVPPPVLGVYDRATWNNIQEGRRQFWTGGNGVISYLRFMEQSLSDHFFYRLKDDTLRRVIARFDLSGIEDLQDDNTAKLTAVPKLTKAGFTPNEAMDQLGLDADFPDEYGERRMIGTDVTPYEQAGMAPIKPAESSDGKPKPKKDGEVTVQRYVCSRVRFATRTEARHWLRGRDARIDKCRDTVSSYSFRQRDASEFTRGSFRREQIEPGVDVVWGRLHDSRARTAAIATDTVEEGKGLDPSAGDGGDLERAAVEVEDAEKQLQQELRLLYQLSFDTRVLKPAEKKLYTPIIAWLRRYELAQNRRLRSFAKHGKSAKAKLNAHPDSEPIEFDGKASFICEKLNQSDIDILMLDPKLWDARLQAAIKKPWADVFEAALLDAASELDVLAIAMTDPEVLGFLKASRIRLARDVTGSLGEAVKKTLLKALQESQSVGSLQAIVQDMLKNNPNPLGSLFGGREARASRIANTEAAMASNGARHIEHKREGVTETEWSTSKDEHVRSKPQLAGINGHVGLDGKRAKVGTTFVKGITLEFPADRRAPPGWTVYCRCVAYPRKRKKKDIQDAVLARAQELYAEHELGRHDE